MADDPKLVMGQGPVPCLAMIVGEAPGAKEVELGVPFVGPSGEILEEALNEAGAERNEFYVTNVYKFRPPENRDPTLRELMAHQDILEGEIKAVNPQFFLILGRVALAWMFPGKVSIGAERGTWFLHPSYACDVIATFHPAATIYDKAKLPLFRQDVAEFVEVVRSYESTEHSEEG